MTLQELEESQDKTVLNQQLRLTKREEELAKLKASRFAKKKSYNRFAEPARRKCALLAVGDGKTEGENGMERKERRKEMRKSKRPDCRLVWESSWENCRKR